MGESVEWFLTFKGMDDELKKWFDTREDEMISIVQDTLGDIDDMSSPWISVRGRRGGGCGPEDYIKEFREAIQNQWGELPEVELTCTYVEQSPYEKFDIQGRMYGSG